MKKTDFISVRIEEELKVKLEKIAEQEERTISNLVYRIIKKYVNDYELPAASAESQRDSRSNNL